MSDYTEYVPVPLPISFTPDSSRAITGLLAWSQWVYRFASGYGASVITGHGAYGGQESLYELATIRFTGPGQDDWKVTVDKWTWDEDDEDAESIRVPAVPHAPTPLTYDVHGWLTLTQVSELLERIAAIPAPPVTRVEATVVPALEA